MSVETDDRGRIYLSKELREKHGDRFRVLDLPNRVVLIPVDENPLEAVRDAAGESFEGRSIEEIRAEILETAKTEIEAEIEEREERGKQSDSN